MSFTNADSLLLVTKKGYEVVFKNIPVLEYLETQASLSKY